MSARMLRIEDAAESRASAVSRTGEAENARRGPRLRSAPIDIAFHRTGAPFAANLVNEEKKGGALAALAGGPCDPRKDASAHERPPGKVLPARQAIEPGDRALELVEAFEVEVGGGDFEQGGDLPTGIARAKAGRRGLLEGRQPSARFLGGNGAVSLFEPEIHGLPRVERWGGRIGGRVVAGAHRKKKRARGLRNPRARECPCAWEGIGHEKRVGEVSHEVVAFRQRLM